MSNPHAQLEFGELSWWYTTGEDNIEIRMADPVILTSGERLAELKRRPYVELRGDLIIFKGDNRTVIYRIVSFDVSKDLFVLRWPD